MLKIYLAAPIRGNQDHQEQVIAIRDWMCSEFTVLTESIFNPHDAGSLTDEEIYERDVRWIDECDVLIAEVSSPSHGVGYEIGYALHKANKIVICLLYTANLEEAPSHRIISAMLNGNPHVEIVPYTTVKQAREGIMDWLRNLFPELD